MGRASAQSYPAPVVQREAVPPEAYDGFDLDEINTRAAELRDIEARHGEDGVASHLAGRPRKVVRRIPSSPSNS